MSLYGISVGAPAPAPGRGLFGPASAAPASTATLPLFGTARNAPRTSGSSTTAGNAAPKPPVTPQTPVKPTPSATPIKDLRKPCEDVPGYRGFLKVSVGKGTKVQTFDVHESLLTARSDFFKRAMSGDWVEARQRLIQLPEDDPDTFKRYVHLLYTNNLAISQSSSNIFSAGQGMTLLAHLYVLAEKLQDTTTKKLVLESMILCLRENPYSLPGVVVVCIIHDETPPNSPMRKLLVDVYTQRATSIYLRSGCKQWPTDFLEELSIQLVTKRLPPVADPIMTSDISEYLDVKNAAKN